LQNDFRAIFAQEMSECHFMRQIFCKFCHKSDNFSPHVAFFASFYAPYALAQRANLLHMRRAFKASSPKLFSPALVPGFFLPGTNGWRAEPVPGSPERALRRWEVQLDCNRPWPCLASPASFKIIR
jgi:hypothetical protein